MLLQLLLLSFLHSALALCGINIAPCGDDAITACVDGFDCEPSLFEDPPFTGCCATDPNNSPVNPATPANPVNPVDPNNQGSNDGSTTSAVTRRAKSSPVVTHPGPHPGVLTCRNSIDDAECEHNKKLCTNKYYVALMAQQCAATCGCVLQHDGITTTRSPAAAPPTSSTRRVAPPFTVCVDLVNNKTGVSDCGTFSYMCNDKVYYAFMTEQCPKTCGRCQTGR